MNNNPTLFAYQIRSCIAWAACDFRDEYPLYSDGCLDAPLILPSGGASHKITDDGIYFIKRDPITK